MDNQTGQSIRELRTGSSISLRELSRMTGISAAYLVSVEKGTSSPTIATLSKILKALGTDLAAFFAKASSGPEKPVFDAEQMQRIQDAYRSCLFLLPKRSDIRFELLHETLMPFEEDVAWEIHECDVGGVLISGNFAELEIDGVGNWPLKQGDSFYIKANQKHRLVNRGKDQLELVTVMDPPRY